MPEHAVVATLARTLFDLEPAAIERLDQYQHTSRGVYRVEDADGRSWVMRLSQFAEMADAYAQAARLFDWLTQQAYPAPAVRRTRDQQPVGLVDGWAVMLLSYVAGSVLTAPSAEDLRAVAQLLGRLHALPGASAQGFTAARCHPMHCRTAAQQLARHRGKVPPAYYPLVDHLCAAMQALERWSEQPLCLTHGDCWYMNAVKAADGSVTLIDWDNAGSGLPLLELGNLLLTAHFDPQHPLVLAANAAAIQAIMHGYAQECAIRGYDRTSLTDAMCFLLAFQLGSYVADDALVVNPEFPFVLQKLQARYAVIDDIATIAADSLT